MKLRKHKKLNKKIQRKRLARMARFQRTTLRLTMRDLAQIAGVSASKICRLEQGKPIDDQVDVYNIFIALELI